VLINVTLTKMVADWVKGAQVVTAMSLLIASWPLGIGVALLIYPQIATALGWPTVMNAAAFSALLALVAIGWIYRDPPDHASAAPRKFGVHLSKREWILASLTGAIWGTYNVGYIVLVSFAPEFFTTRGYSLERASSIVSLVGWLLIPSVPVSGYLVERLRRPDLLVFAGLGAVTIALAVLPSVSAPAALFFFIALLIGIPAGLIMALPANVLRSESLAAGMGVRK
jgi:cyanate permease